MWILCVITFHAIIHGDDKAPTSASPTYAYVDKKADAKKNIINANLSSESKHSPGTHAADALPVPPPKTLWWAEILDSMHAELRLHTHYKPPNIKR